MITPAQLRMMARYNRWQNRSIFNAASQLDEAARRADRGAFFGSIHATLAHTLWADRAWMSRLAGLPMPQGKGNDPVFLDSDSWDTLCAGREDFDAWLIDWADAATGDELAGDLHWTSVAAKADFDTPRWVCLTHVFNHQTHHRGQAHALITAAGIKPEDTDIVFMPEPAWD